MVLGSARLGAPPDPERVTQLGSVLEQYGWRGRVPVVVTRAGLHPDEPGTAALQNQLDRYGASLVHHPLPSRPGSISGG